MDLTPLKTQLSVLPPCPCEAGGRRSQALAQPSVLAPVGGLSHRQLRGDRTVAGPVLSLPSDQRPLLLRSRRLSFILLS